MKTALSPRRCARITQRALVHAVILAAVPGWASGQHSEVQGLASRIAAETAQTGKKRVAVADFPGPEESFTELGRLLAIEFTASLGWAGANLEVTRVLNLPAVLREQGMSPKNQVHPRVAQRLGQLAGADVVVLGTIEPQGEWMGLSVKAVDVSDGRVVSEATGKISKTAAMEQLLAKPLLQSTRSEAAIDPGDCASFGSDVLMPGRNGISHPKCLRCPDPTYSEQARKQKIVGNVVLRSVVTPEGRPDKITVVRSLGYGLDENAVKAIQGWVFDPARDAAGRPVAVCIRIEASFRLK